MVKETSVFEAYNHSFLIFFQTAERLNPAVNRCLFLKRIVFKALLELNHKVVRLFYFGEYNISEVVSVATYPSGSQCRSLKAFEKLRCDKLRKVAPFEKFGKF